ncbi:MAG: F0F1 ATP synthase subunit B [Planctomycetota bacterium]|nr:F0F1 ATP synthase subunit B [Planctomycetota bacterium]MDA0918925.1 F0F1 ATP synthase subunit B [Planctomycetota bacterium]
MQPQNDLVLWTIVTFVLFLVVLKKVAWGPLIEGLDNRESKYRKLLEDAKADRDKAVSLLADYEQKLKTAQGQVDEIIAEARRDAERTKTDILATAQQDAEATRKRALDDIGRARDQAVAELFEHVRANVVAVTEKVLSRSLTDADDQKLIDDALAEMSAAQG